MQWRYKEYPELSYALRMVEMGDEKPIRSADGIWQHMNEYVCIIFLKTRHIYSGIIRVFIKMFNSINPTICTELIIASGEVVVS